MGRAARRLRRPVRAVVGHDKDREQLRRVVLQADALEQTADDGLFVARAILADAPILLLDEVTSALDLETEQRVLENIAALPGKTCILSTHRPSVLGMCSRVYRVHEGTVEEIDARTAEKLTMDY